MKPLKIILLTLCGIIGLITLSCEKANDSKEIFLELPFNGDKTSIISTFENIEFNFCLLNKDSIPATSLSEGENFSFYFSLTNNRNDSLHLDNTFFLENDNSCMVYSENNAPLGRPFIYKGMEKIGSGAHPFYGSSSKYELIIPWQDERNAWSTLHCYLESSHQNLLPKGKYYTVFKHRFCFRRKFNQPSLCIDSITFKINFEIKYP